MFAKPISIILVYIMVIINLIIITLPFSAVIFSILILSKSGLAFGSISANLLNGDLLYKFYKFFMALTSKKIHECFYGCNCWSMLEMFSCL